MGWRDLSLGRWLRALLVTALPLALAFIVLAGLGLLAPGTAALTWLALTLVSAVAIRCLLSDLVGTRDQLNQMVRGEGIEARHGYTRIGRELAQSLQRLERVSNDRIACLKSDHEGMERALNALPVPILLLNNGQNVVRANRASEELLGGKLEGRDLAAVLRNPDVVTALEQASRTGLGQDVAFSLQAPVPRHFSARVAPLSEHAADGTSMVLALVDMTAMRRADQMRADFIANASHEIRTPLTTLRGFIETLSGPAEEDLEAQRKFLAIMAQHAERMTRLVDDLLSLSRIEMNEHTVPTSRVELPPLLATVVDSLDWQASQRGAKIEQNIEAELPSLSGDAGELTQLFQNLIDNAIKYGREGGAVQVRAWQEATGERGTDEAINIMVSVSDEGEGIEREHLPRLTERFYRVDNARSRELGGTGLGLAIVKHIASRHRAALTIESEFGKGSTFTLKFPPAVFDMGENVGS